MAFRADAFMGEFEGDLLRALDIRGGLHHEVVEVQVCEAEGIDDSEVRYRIGLRGTDGGTHWFVSEQVLFVEDEDDQETVERIGSVLEGLQEDRIRERLREAELIDD